MSIIFNENSRSFYLSGGGMTYAFKILKNGFLQHLYFGKKIASDDLSHTVSLAIRGHSAAPLNDMGGYYSYDEIFAECPTYGRSDFRESMLAFNVDGVRVGDLFYVSHDIFDEKPALAGMPSLRGGQTLAITLCDELHDLYVKLYYTVYEELPVVARRMEVLNKSNKEIVLDRAYSFSFDLPDSSFETISLPGGHLRERQLTRNPLVQGIYTVNSKYGVSSSQMNPFLALVRKSTTEEQGDAYGINLIYSGNFALKAEVGQGGSARVLGGINDYDFEWTLGAGESFSTPEAVMVYSSEGLGGMSRAFHDLYRNYLMNERFAKVSRPIVLNNWEGTYFDFNEEKLCKLIRKAAGTGIDMFVLDDGWFGARNHDRAGLGDWFINYNKLPNGFKKIIECAHENGMRFGLWFEPEMVNPDSELYRAHPDWAIHVDGIEPCQGRNQLVLDLTLKAVRDYIVKVMSDILASNEIDYVKWDMNRVLTENYSAELGKRGKEFAHRYVLGLYDILAQLKEGFPKLFIEGCASGGCRFDAAMLYYCPQIWTSDNSDAYSRTHIQYGTSLCYPLSAMSCHVSVCPNHQTGRNTPLASRAAIAHLGATGYELDTEKLSAEELETVKKEIAEYRAIEGLILKGDLYRTNDPAKENLFAETVVAKDKSAAVVTLMKPLHMANGFPTRVYPRGLSEGKRYRIKELDTVLGGDTIMNAGILVNIPWGDFVTAVYHIEEVK